jgi:hypothetical protein
MKSYLLEAIANHLNAVDSNHEYDDKDRDYLRRLFVQHAFLLNAIESDPECQALVEETMNAFMLKQREELKPEPKEKSSIIIPFHA